ncbi:hypothetical protein [Streptomyces sp. SAS_272]|uniref:hypothetical protein n=1 Tax=Streptomyces sp. SAS_272 TaxID=3412747 RepID=UPI00403C4C01
MLIEEKARFTCPLAGPLPGGAGCTESPTDSHAATNEDETNTLPWSTTMVCEMITGRAAAPTSRASTPSSRSYGITEWSIASASAQPGRIGAGTIICASNCAASTLRFPSSSTHRPAIDPIYFCVLT